MSSPTQLNPGQPYEGSKPVRDPQYLKFVKRLPCLVCLATWRVDPCHTGPHGTGQKSCDFSAIPLCRVCHAKYDANPHKFAEFYKLDIPALIEMFNSFYRTKITGEAA